MFFLVGYLFPGGNRSLTVAALKANHPVDLACSLFVHVCGHGLSTDSRGAPPFENVSNGSGGGVAHQYDGTGRYDDRHLLCRGVGRE